MENFVAYNPTKLHFGKDVCHDLGNHAGKIGKKALLMFGKGSVLKNGSYDTVKKQLGQNHIEIIEYGGIKSNPIVEDVDAAAAAAIDKACDLVVAVGGGSVIDSAKITSLCIAHQCKGWEVMKNKIEPSAAVPLIAVLTLAATGTEMNPVAVLQNHATREKIGYRHPLMYPVHSFLDPGYTLSVPANYTAYGIVDLTAHCLEAFFGEGDASLSDRFVEAIIKEAMLYGPQLMDNLQSYDLRARIMWAATNALNGLTSFGRKNGDWGVHALGHVLSFLYDTAHGATLSIAYPAWLKLQKDRVPERIAELGRHLFGKMDADAAIEGLENFFKKLGSPVRLSEEGINADKKEEITALMRENKSSGIVHKLSPEDYDQLVDLMMM